MRVKGILEHENTCVESSLHVPACSISSNRIEICGSASIKKTQFLSKLVLSHLSSITK